MGRSPRLGGGGTSGSARLVGKCLLLQEGHAVSMVSAPWDACLTASRVNERALNGGHDHGSFLAASDPETKRGSI